MKITIAIKHACVKVFPCIFYGVDIFVLKGHIVVCIEFTYCCFSKQILTVKTQSLAPCRNKNAKILFKLYYFFKKNLKLIHFDCIN